MLPITELKLQDCKKIFTPEFLRQLSKIYMCGNYGDPAMASDTADIFAYLREFNLNLYLEMFTNGGVREEAWWRTLAQVGVHVRFAIDGLEDTNHIYRRGTNWRQIIRNAEAFIDAGGVAKWDYIVFRHNEHQVDQARELAKNLGFRDFQVKKTGRFFSNTKVATKESQPVYSLSGEVEYVLELPSSNQYLNPSLQRENRIAEKYGSLKTYLEKCEIDCRVSKEKSVYISAQGHVFPCCWTANQMYPWYKPERGTEIWKILNELPGRENSISALIHSVQGIVEGPFFERVAKSWQKPTFSDGRLFSCAKACTRKDFDPFDDQWGTKEKF